MRLRRAVLFFFVVAATRLLGCGSSVTATKYDQTCKYASDCIVVGVGDPCSTPCIAFPSSDAIAVRAEPTYRLDAIDAQFSCNDSCSHFSNCTNTVAATNSAYCNAGTCAVCNDVDSCKCAPMDPTCGNKGSPAPPDAGTDAPADAPPATDAGDDGATPDAGVDSGTDAPAVDAADAAGTDAPVDAPPAG